MEIASSLIHAFSSQPLFVAAIITLLCFSFVIFAFRAGSILFLGKKDSSVLSTDISDSSTVNKGCNCTCSCNDPVLLGSSDFGVSASSTSLTSRYLNGGMVEMLETPMVADRQTGASMMEQLVPEITTHALSYLDYPSLCRLSMTNSLMRKAANDDNAWKALYHKDFTLEQDSVTPINGWKAYYAATRAIVNINAGFFNIIRERSVSEMSRFWRNADYVKCAHASGEFFSGYNAVMRSWQLAFEWEQGFNFQIHDVRARVLSDMAWVTMKTYVDMNTGPFNVTNIFEFHNGRWYMVHHHSSVMLIDGEMEQQIVPG